jgi:hypothetical protein
MESLGRTLHAAICVKTTEMGKIKKYVISQMIPQRAHIGSESEFRADNQPEKRGRPRGSRNKISPAMKKMILEVIQELGNVPYKDWDKLR